MCVFLSALDQTIITTAIPVIAGEFRSPSAYTWIGTSYLLASAALVPTSVARAERQLTLVY